MGKNSIMKAAPLNSLHRNSSFLMTKILAKLQWGHLVYDVIEKTSTRRRSRIP